MQSKVIDAHIHLDKYQGEVRKKIIEELDTYQIEALLSVSTDALSAKHTIRLAQKNARVKPAIGYHPEQKIPSLTEVETMMQQIDAELSNIFAIGEVGLPYYLRQENHDILIDPYIELLEAFIKKTVEIDKPIVLHAIYEDAAVACHLLEKYSIKKAHFHWFKADNETVERMIRNGYFISFTPDILYEPEHQQLVKKYPIQQIMVETDGPWPFEGPFKQKTTHPKMVHDVLDAIATIKQIDRQTVYKTIYNNTKQFYNL